MNEEKQLIFDNLLKKRKQLSKMKKDSKKNISSDDNQLMNIINNFDETDAYKEMQSDN